MLYFPIIINTGNSLQEVLAIVDGKEPARGHLITLSNYVPYQGSQRSYEATPNLVTRDFVLTEEIREVELEEKDPVVEIKTTLF
jgi:hypothetical protein